MVEISLSGSGEGPGWETGPGYSTYGELFPLARRARRASAACLGAMGVDQAGVGAIMMYAEFKMAR